MTNILKAIYNISKDDFMLDNLRGTSLNRIQNVGEGLEIYIKDKFANIESPTSENQKNKIYNQHFSWLGTSNHPPDIMIKNGDAIEVKKIIKHNASIALNSSHPKNYLYASSKYITEACRACEVWDKKDIIYAIGNVEKDVLKCLWLVYGNIYAADQEIYLRVKDAISNGISDIPHITSEPTNELGRLNNVDPLSITNLRIRGMWHIKHPYDVFSYLNEYHNFNNAKLIALIPNEKYNSFPDEDQKALKSFNNDILEIFDVQVKNPNNPAHLLDCKLVVLKP